MQNPEVLQRKRMYAWDAYEQVTEDIAILQRNTNSKHPNVQNGHNPFSIDIYRELILRLLVNFRILAPVIIIELPISFLLIKLTE